MNKTFAGIFLIAFTTLMIELVLIRVFDVILYPNMAYMVVTCTLFAFGLSGIYVTLRPPTFATEGDFHTFLCKCAAVFALLVVIILPIANFLPLNYFELNDRPITIASSYLVLYLVLTGPFFVAGLIMPIRLTPKASIQSKSSRLTDCEERRACGGVHLHEAI